MPEEIHATNEIDINVEIDDNRTAEAQDSDNLANEIIDNFKQNTGCEKGFGMAGLDLPLAFGGIEGMKGIMQQGKAGAMNPMGMLMQQLPQMIMKALPKMVLRAIPIIGGALLKFVDFFYDYLLIIFIRRGKHYYTPNYIIQ